MVATDEVEMEQEMLWEYISVGQAGKSSTLASNTESSLIHAAQQGDLSAFNRLVLSHQDSLYRWAVSLVHDNMLAYDITQWTFVTAYEKLSSFRGGSFRAWLFRIARNRSFDELRYRKHHAFISLDDAPDDDSDRLEVLPNGEALPEDALVMSEQAVMVENLLNQLSVPFQQALRLIDMEGMDYQEAADVLSLPLGTIKSRLARARLKMRQLFQSNR